ncbi:MAG TPA: hypothetical protein VHD88_06005 [Pyrinomonadaceae bacterium]|nr:hypothetical protein [Pyrinomonadaceae bacterium]
MLKRAFAFSAAFIVTASTVQFAQTRQQPVAPRYQMPPKEIVEAFDAPLLPTAILSPSKQVIALVYRKNYPTISELFAADTSSGRIAYQSEDERAAAHSQCFCDHAVPPQANLSNVRFSPDGSRLSFLNTKENGIELWIADAATGKAKMVSGTDRLNATTGDPCDWLHDNVTLICELVPTGRGPAPAEPSVPMGPNIIEDYGKAAPAATYEDMIKTWSCGPTRVNSATPTQPVRSPDRRTASRPSADTRICFCCCPATRFSITPRCRSSARAKPPTIITLSNWWTTPRPRSTKWLRWVWAIATASVSVDTAMARS